MIHSSFLEVIFITIFGIFSLSALLLVLFIFERYGPIIFMAGFAYLFVHSIYLSGRLIHDLFTFLKPWQSGVMMVIFTFVGLFIHLKKKYDSK